MGNMFSAFRSGRTRTRLASSTAQAPLAPLAMTLEPRFMFDAAGATTAVEAAEQQAAEDAADDAIATATPAPEPTRREVAFIDTGVDDWETLRDSVSPGVEVVLLEADQDGLAQMAAWARQNDGYDAMHVLSHGGTGFVTLGTARLDSDTTDARAADLAVIGNALAEDGDILLYGCDVASDDDGRTFVAGLAAATGVDVAASDDPTGAASLGGDGELEFSSGPVDVPALYLRDFNSLLATTITTVTESDSSGYNNSTSDDLGQSFTATSSANISSINYLMDGTTGTTTFNIKIYQGEGYSGTLLYTSSSINVSDTYTDSSNWTYSTHNLESAVAVTNGSKYTVRLVVDDSITLHYYGNTYAGGTIFGSTGSSYTSLDLPLTVTLSADTTPPAAPTGLDLAAASDTGTSSTDNITSDTTPTISGSAEAGSTVKLYNGVTEIGSATAAGNGSWTITASALAAGQHTLTAKATDAAGNQGAASSGLGVTIDTAGPTVTDGHIAISGGSGTGGAYKIGDTVTATWDNTGAGENNSDTIAAVTANFSAFGGGAAVAATENAGTWTATYTIAAGAIDATNANVSVTATDNAGNTTTTADTTNATVDNQPATVTDANISISGGSGTGGAYKIGDTVTATWNNTGAGNNNSDTIAAVTANFSAFGGGAAVAATENAGTWTATYQIVAGAIQATNRNVSVTATDNAGNATTTADTTNATVDSVAATVTDANISLSGGTGTGGAFKIGDTVTATWNNTGAGDNNVNNVAKVTVDFSAFGGGAAVAGNNWSTGNAGIWAATYTIAAGAIDATNRNASVTVTDTGGNLTTAADTTNATVDNVAATVTDANISLSGGSGTGGAYKIGDTVTATWNNTGAGDNNSDTIASATVDFSAFGGGAAVAATENAGTWTATYQIVAGAGGGIQATNRNVSVTATDNAGNTTTTADTTNATVDNVAATVTDANISISGGTGGTFKIGDTVTATWNNTGAGDNNSDTIASATVDFSAFGGGAAVAATENAGTWTATYQIVAGAGGGIQATNRNVSVTATDTSGNATTTADTTNTTVDNAAPTPASTAPADGAVGVAIAQDITLTFDELVKQGSGDITLYNVTDSSVIATIAAADGQVSGWGGTTITVNPTVDLPYSKVIAVQWAAGVFTDGAGNAGAAVTDTTTLNFTTAAAPVSQTTTPTPTPTPEPPAAPPPAPAPLPGIIANAPVGASLPAAGGLGSAPGGANGVGNSGTPVSAAMTGNDGGAGSAPGGTNSTIISPVRGSLGSASALDNSGTPVSQSISGLAAGAGGGFSGGLGGGFGGGLGGNPGGGFGNATTAPAGTDGGPTNGAPGDTAPGDDAEDQLTQAEDTRATEDTAPQPDLAVLGATPFSRQLAAVQGYTAAGQDALAAALAAHRPPQQAA